MLKYICVLIPALYYALAFGFGSVLFAATGSVVFREFYNFNLIETGLILSIPLLIGSFIGEANAGWFVDWLIFKYSQRHDGERTPEPRLKALWLALLLPLGTLVNGICISHARSTSWVGNAFGMGLANFGLQVSTTVVYTYTTDASISRPVHVRQLTGASVTNHKVLTSQVFLTSSDPYSVPLSRFMRMFFSSSR